MNLDELGRLLSEAGSAPSIDPTWPGFRYLSDQQWDLILWQWNNAQAMRDELLELRAEVGRLRRRRPTQKCHDALAEYAGWCECGS